MRWRVPLSAALAALLLAACASAPPPSPVPENGVLALARAHQASLAGIDTWSVKGRIGLVHGEEGWHAGIDWRQQGNAYQIQLDGPLGQTAMRLVGDASGITLLLPDRAPLSADRPEALLRETMNLDLPVSGLRWWVTGRVPPNANAVSTLDDAGRLSDVREDGWVVRFQDYIDVDGVELPRKLRLERAEVTIKLVLNDWHLGT